jgi:hypothetical protein
MLMSSRICAAVSVAGIASSANTGLIGCAQASLTEAPALTICASGRRLDFLVRHWFSIGRHDYAHGNRYVTPSLMSWARSLSNSIGRFPSR